MKHKILTVSAAAFVFLSGCQTSLESSGANTLPSYNFVSSQPTVYESVMFADSQFLVDLNSCIAYDRPEDAEITDNCFFKMKFTTSMSNGVAGPQTVVDVIETEQIDAKTAFDIAEVPVVFYNKMLDRQFYYGELERFMAYYDKATGNECFIYCSGENYYAVSEDNPTILSYDECRVLFDRYIVFCDSDLSDDEIMEALTKGDLSENRQIFYVGTKQFDFYDHVSAQMFVTDGEVIDAKYVIEDWAQLSQLDDLIFPIDVQSEINNILNDEKIVVIISGNDIPADEQYEILLDKNNRICLSSTNTCAGYAVIGISVEAAKGICLS